MAYSCSVGDPGAPGRGFGLFVARSWKRLPFALGPALAIGLLLPGWDDRAGLLVRTVTLGLVAMAVFGLFEQWPRRLPAWLARWVLQVVGVGVAMPLTTWQSICSRPRPARRPSGTSRRG